MAQIEIFKSAEESAAHVVSGRSILFASIGHVTREVLSVLTKYIYLKTNRPVKTIHVSGKKKKDISVIPCEADSLEIITCPISSVSCSRHEAGFSLRK